jgi:hypothetical protein
VPQFTFGVFADNVNGFSAVSTGLLRFSSAFIPQKVQNAPKIRHFGIRELPPAAVYGQSEKLVVMLSPFHSSATAA